MSVNEYKWRSCAIVVSYHVNVSVKFSVTLHACMLFCMKTIIISLELMSFAGVLNFILHELLHELLRVHKWCKTTWRRRAFIYHKIICQLGQWLHMSTLECKAVSTHSHTLIWPEKLIRCYTSWPCILYYYICICGHFR
jgi:hypothetical protein